MSLCAHAYVWVYCMFAGVALKALVLGLDERTEQLEKVGERTSTAYC